MTRLNELLIQASEKFGYPGYLDAHGIFRMRRGGYNRPAQQRPDEASLRPIRGGAIVNENIV